MQPLTAGMLLLIIRNEKKVQIWVHMLFNTGNWSSQPVVSKDGLNFFLCCVEFKAKPRSVSWICLLSPFNSFGFGRSGFLKSDL